MNNTVALDRPAALRAERRQMIQFCSSLDEDAWMSPSAAAGWRIKDVVAHMGSSCHSLFTPSSVKLLRSSDIEQSNEDLLGSRRDWAPDDVLDEFSRWSARVARLAALVAATPMNSVRVPFAELGRYRLGLLLGGAMVFDQHTHLRFDMAPALGRDAPPTDANRMSVVVEWMLAVLANQLHSNSAEWMDRPVSLTLTGPGGGRWKVSGDGVVTASDDSDGAAARIVTPATQFPDWATARARWRDRDVTVEGDVEFGGRFLDSLNIV